MSPDHMLYKRFSRKAAIGAVYALVAVSFFGFLGWATSVRPACTLVPPTEVHAGLDYEDGRWTYKGDGRLFGFAPSEDSLITPASCYEDYYQANPEDVP